MARIRTIKPEFWTDEKLAPMSALTRLTFLGLVSMADDAGRLVDSVKHLDGLLFSEAEDTCGAALDQLEAAGIIQRGVAGNGRKVIQIAGWSKHQKVDHPNEKASLPAIKDHSRTSREFLARDSAAASDELATRPTTDDLRPTIYEQRPTTYDRR